MSLRHFSNEQATMRTWRSASKLPMHEPTIPLAASHTLKRYQSVRELTFPHLDSSEATPSPHSSLYDAGDFALSSGEEEASNDQYVSPHLGSRGEGTRLFTIHEKNSVPSLKTIPSNWTFQRQVVLDTDERRTRRCFSFDDGLLRKDNTFGESEAMQSESDGASEDRNARPAVPPFKPPERQRTPDGVPRWNRLTPNFVPNTDGSNGSRQNTAPKRRSPFLRACAVIFRGRSLEGRRPRPPVTPSVRTGRLWRPPVSGHGTPHFTNVDDHPFASATIDRPPLMTQPMQVKHSPSDGLQRHGVWHPALRRHPLNTVDEDTMQLGPAQRSLQALNGNAVHVSTERVVRHESARSVALPASLKARNLSSSVPSTPQKSGNDSTRTMDLISAFPRPPVPRAEPRWSLFPQTAGDSTLPTADAATQWHSATGQEQRSEAMQNQRVVHFSQNGLSTDQRRSLDGLQREQSLGTRALTSPRRNSAEVTRAVGNGAARFSSNRASSTEQQTRVNENQPASQPVRAAGDRGAQAEDVMVPVTLTHIGQLCPHKLAKLQAAEAKEKEKRIPMVPLANGQRGQEQQLDGNTDHGPPQLDGLFHHRHYPSIPPTHSAPAPVPEDDGETSDEEPTTVTDEEPTTIARPAGAGQPGPTAIVQPVTGAQPQVAFPADQARPANATANTADNTADRRQSHFSTASSSRYPPPPLPSRAWLVRRRNERGTWRTRMGRTKCWRCEMEARAQRGWKRVTGLLEWTCFCRYRAYNDDEDMQWDGVARPLQRRGLTGFGQEL